jgi:hypothetical protein
VIVDKDQRYQNPFFVLGFFFFVVVVLVGLGFFKPGLGACKAGDLLLEPHLQSILLWLFWRWVLKNYLPRLASNQDPPDTSLREVGFTGISHGYPASKTIKERKNSLTINGVKKIGYLCVKMKVDSYLTPHKT